MKRRSFLARLLGTAAAVPAAAMLPKVAAAAEKVEFEDYGEPGEYVSEASVWECTSTCIPVPVDFVEMKDLLAASRRKLPLFKR